MPALGGRAHPCARLGLAPVCVAALFWSPWAWRGAVAPRLGGPRWPVLVLWSVGVSRGSFSLCSALGVFCRSFRSRRVRALVGLRAGRFVSPVVPVVLRACGGCSLLLSGRGFPVRRFVGAPAWPGLPLVLRSPGSRCRWPCARPRFRPCALAPSALPPGGWGWGCLCFPFWGSTPKTAKFFNLFIINILYEYFRN